MGDENVSRREVLAATGAAVATVMGASVVAESAPPDERDLPRPAPKVMAPGKIYVITDASGEVIGTAYMGPREDKDGPVPLVPRPRKAGQRVHEMDYTPELEKLNTAEEVHRAVGKLIKK